MNFFRLRVNLTLLAVFTFIAVWGQSAGLAEKMLPVDPKVKIGKLDNGFTYYIRQNSKPENRIEMRLVVNAGSILEDEDQLGLAHFVEHMCFNGTKHFEKNELVEYLQSIGLRFGPDLNAYTSFDETVYMLTLPSDSTELVSKGFLVMEDWAHNVSFDSIEIDKERGVVIEEWRLGRGPWQRMLDIYLPVVFKDSRYAERLPIGKKEIIENADYEVVKRFYRDWYRPDLMALVVVGDIDPDIAEKKIIEHFSNLVAPENIRERKSYPIPDQQGTLASVSTDSEAPVSVVRLIYKTDPVAEETEADYMNYLRYAFLTGMMNRRLAELTELEDPPFVGSSFQYGSLWARSKDALQGYALVGEKDIERGLQTLLIENRRVSDYGFTQGEFDRFKLDLLKRYENVYNERDKTESKNWAEEYKSNFLRQEPIPGIEFEYEFVNKHINDIRLAEINTLAKELIHDHNRVIVVNAPEKDNVVIPTEDEVIAVAGSVEKMEILAYEDKLANGNLISEMPERGSISGEKVLEELDCTELFLSNGARVILKPTDFKNDEVLFTAFSEGGHSVYPDAYHFTALNTDGIIQESGVGEYSNSDIRKLLAGKTVYVAPSIGYETESLGGHTKSSDLESMFQLMNQYFTNPRVDSGAFNSYLKKKKDLFRNLVQDPQNYFFDKYYRIKAQDHPRGDYLPGEEDWKNIDYQRAIEIYKDRFSDPGNFTFILVGAFQVDSVKVLFEKYIAGLTSADRKETFIDLGMRPPAGKNVHNIYKGNDPKSLALVYFEKETVWNRKDAYMIGVLADILGFRYVEKLREEMSGVYTVRTNASMQKIPYSAATLQIMIPCSPDNVDSLVNAAIAEIADIQVSGATDKDITKARETRRRQLETNVKTNNFWLSGIQRAILMGEDLSSITNEEFIEQITGEEIQRIANQYFTIDEYLKVVLYPESMKSE